MIARLNGLPPYEVWIREKMVEEVEEAFRNFLDIDNDVSLNYYMGVCIPDSDGKCQKKHKLVWCGGMTLPQFVRKALKQKHFYSLFVTSYTSKGAVENADEEEGEKRTYWICDAIGDRLICCDEMWGWLFYHIRDKKAK